MVGYIDILGSPISLLTSFGTGVYDFFYEPAQAILSSPQDFFKSVKKGTASLVGKSLYGIFNSLSKISGSVGKVVATLSEDRAYIKERQRVMGPLGSCYFDDDTGNVTDKHTNEISDVMRHLGIPWGMMCRADTSSGATWQKMKDSGCFGVKIGFESGSQRVVDKIVGKKLDLKEARETAIWLRKIGLSVHGTFMVGLPGETPDERQETYNFIEQLYRDGGLDTHQLSGTALIDGTPLANLKPGETQTAYPDAKKDENYVEMKDGQLKAEMMTRALAVK